ncbi:ribosome recycling factor family protein [Shewanella sp. 10N.286.52.B9]|uniref:ribosome recycling factor family protein n=1 Tax=Shewanella sp. 10N.286.52.B9 TaxID=1880837 RepID=UPI000C847FE3|nr:ribosome recycling factor family protein [Shewanella sp. 10N.286.52.B9]PMG40960.1 ribosome recycling factor [Shewanella sp. 10N.286.52.B9]
MNEGITIALPSLFHRIGGSAAKQAKDMAKQYGCELKRVRRSRNWQLVGDAVNIQSFAAQLHGQANTEFAHLIKKINIALLEHSDKLEPLAVKLVRLLTERPSTTLAELIQSTGCTEAEARVARFDADSW